MLLYIHIPFCDSKCYYCAFNSYVDKFKLKVAYMKALEEQLEHDIDLYLKNTDKKIETVFIGGGTPSCVEASLYEKVFKIIKPYLIKDIEITTEANPNSATKEWQEAMKAHGVNRISFGVQSFKDHKLKALGRAHKSISAISAIQNAACIGFKGINCDIIYGVKGDTFESIKEDLDIIRTLPITHLSAYSLIIEEGTKFFNKSYMKIDDEELSYQIFDEIKSMGLEQYEISNFAINEESKSSHNFGYWQHKEYLGIGTGAVGYINKQRLYPLKDIEKYIETPLFKDIEILSDDDIKTEKILLGLRSQVGVNKSLLNKEELKRAEFLISENKLSEKNGTIYNKNYLLSDEVVLYILD
ncbi:MAG: coproporphyrinogen III oxidase family protein [Campylobacteraceae bacterium]|nr:coproporphyrinogen III oxidase family protein [Campylobacteraceae bacterium]